MADDGRTPVRRPKGAPSLPEKVVAIHQALERAHIPHAVGGALALAYYAEPRVTVDVDLNVFLSVDRWSDVRDALDPLGVDTKVDAEALNRDGQVRLWWDRNPVDLFFSYDPFHEQMRRGARQVPFEETTIPILSPEHLAVCKAMFDRVKDWLDIEQILVATSPLEVEEIETWLLRMVGDADPRVGKLREIRRRLGV